jgi:heme oxygenase (mycobilin-producing)
MTKQRKGSRARVVFLIRVPTERTEEFLDAYEKIRYQVAEGVPGHIVDQVCQSSGDPEQWLITSEWDSLESFQAWEESPDHRMLVRSMRECMTEARSIRFTVRAQTARRGLRCRLGRRSCRRR